jgi:hypothetical protein
VIKKVTLIIYPTPYAWSAKIVLAMNRAVFANKANWSTIDFPYTLPQPVNSNGLGQLFILPQKIQPVAIELTTIGLIPTLLIFIIPQKRLEIENTCWQGNGPNVVVIIVKTLKWPGDKVIE